MSETKSPFLISANIYEYKTNDAKSKSRAALLVVSYRYVEMKIVAVIIENEIFNLEIGQEQDGSSMINKAMKIIQDDGFNEQIYKNSNTMDINTTEGTEKMMDIIRIGTNNHDAILELMKLFGTAKLKL